MRNFSFIALLVIGMLGFSLIEYRDALYAQSTDCGSGVPQRLEVGGQGQVIPGQERNRLRSAPFGDPVGFVETGVAFDVIDGPECSGDITWWQVTTSDGLTGWTAEGVEGEAYLEPVTASSASGSDVHPNDIASGLGLEFELRDDGSVIVESNNCEGPPRFEVGDQVEIANPDALHFYGHPQLENGFFSSQVMETLVTSEPNYDGLLWFEFFYYSSKYLFESVLTIGEGPRCVNGAYLVRVTSTLWYFESDLRGSSIVEPVNFTTEVYDWYPVGSAPVIDASGQLTYSAGGGGDNMGFHWDLDECGTFTGLTIHLPLYVYTPECFAIYPVDSGSVKVRLLQPVGTVFDEFESQTESLTINWILRADTSSGMIETEAIFIDIPTQLGVQAGIWTIEVEIGGKLYQRSYRLYEGSENKFWLCEGPHPQLLLYQYNGRSVDLVLLDQAGEGFIDDDRVINLPAIEIERWTVDLPESGSLVIQPRFRLPTQGILVVVDSGDDWRSLTTTFNDWARVPSVPGPICADPEATQKVEPGAYATGIGNFTFDGTIGQGFDFFGHIHTALNPTSARSEALGGTVQGDPGLIGATLFAPDGTVVVSANPEADLVIQDVVLPATGEYRLEVVSENQAGIPGWIITLSNG